MDDAFHLQRFVDAQEPIFETAYAELRRGRKTSHWMWFIFPQIAGLGQSETARRFEIASRHEALAYLNHPILGERLRRCTDAVNEIEGRRIDEIFGHPDNLKFHSSMTLFGIILPGAGPFLKALDKYFAGELDSATVTYFGEE